MRVRFLRAAAADLRRITSQIAQDKPAPAARLVQRIDAHLELIAATAFPAMARIGRRSGTRELVERPYIIVDRYDERADELVAVSVAHGARRC